MKIQIHLARQSDYPIVHNLIHFYVYDLAAEVGWPCPDTGLFDGVDDLRDYFDKSQHHPYLIRVSDELAGFMLIKNLRTPRRPLWSMGEFFILKKFRRQSVGRRAFQWAIRRHKGNWQVLVLPKNRKAQAFWSNVIPDAASPAVIVSHAKKKSWPDEMRAWRFMIKPPRHVAPPPRL